MSDRPRDLAERRALLVARAELERAQLALAVHDLKHRDLAAVVAQSPASAAAAIASTLVRFAVPLLGITRAGRWVRIASIGLAVLPDRARLARLPQRR